MEYPKIETLYERNPDTFKVQPGVFKNRTYTIPKRWHFTEKIDGTNIRVMWDPTWFDGTERGKLSFGGRTDNAQIHADLYKRLQKLFPIHIMGIVFPDIPVVLYGEGYGPGIQKGGGDYISQKDFILFDVLIDGKWWLNWESVQDVAVKLNVSVVPDMGFMTLEEATELVRDGFYSRVPGARRQAEGVVGRTEEPLFDKKGHRLIVKLKTKDF